MTNPYPSPAPKRLERSRSDKFLFGVCGGLARYLNMDPTLVRVLTVILTLVTGIPIIVYLVAAFVMPEEGSPTPPRLHPPTAPPATWTPPPPAYEPMANTRPTTGSDPIWGTEGAPWEQRSTDRETPFPGPQPPAPDAPEAPVVPPPANPDR